MYQKYAALIFDMDGTLVDSGQLHQNAWIKTFNRYSIPVDYALMRSLAGVPTKQTIEIVADHFEIDLAVSSDEMNYFKEAIVRATLLDYVQATPLLEVVKEYHGKKPMAVGTGAYTDEAELILKACGLSPYFDYVVGADQVTQPKPAPDTYLHCAKLLKVNPADCVVFEDAPAGMQAARRAGMEVVDVLQTLNIKNDYFLDNK
ncbi:beta-phosphoglucomutase family hydrolase [Gayadomonas joobiniege]|uniref:beta-phosphoglucomutase family hydrolase n=1 Tax=Gayadomonas joobiniege TaxID=1234606 RepID=UPI00037C464F|nr:beta-phosphoglucomutase family hydrolase [Gayadomonas joobiniege]